MRAGVIGTVAMGREAVLAAVRAALAGVTAPALPPAVAEETAGDVDALARQFCAEARAVGTVVHEVASDAQAVAVVAAILTEADAVRAVACPAGRVRAVASAAAERAAVVLDLLDGVAPPEIVAGADVGITGADALVAASGTLVLAARGRARTASLLPPTHVVIADRSSLVADLATALRGLCAAAELDACVTLITGPSRTADIEKKLVVGVHGPCMLHVVLVAGDEG